MRKCTPGNTPRSHPLDVHKCFRCVTRECFGAGQRCWAADSQGQIACLELKLGKLQGVIRGCAGSVRCLAIHPSLPILASACLDRFLRLHDLSSRKLLAKYASCCPVY